MGGGGLQREDDICLHRHRRSLHTIRLVGMHSNRNRVNCRRAAPSAPTSSNKHYCKTVAFFNLGLRGPQGSPIQKKSRKNQTETGLQDHCLPICFSNRFSLVSCPFSSPVCVRHAWSMPSSRTVAISLARCLHRCTPLPTKQRRRWQRGEFRARFRLALAQLAT